MLLLYVEVPTCGFDEVFQFVVRRAYIFVEGLSVVPSAPRVCTIQVSLQYNSVVLLFVYPVLRRCPHIGLSHRISRRKLVHIHKLECGPRRGLCLGDGQTSVYFPSGVGVHLFGVMAAHLCNFRKEGRMDCC